jgi:hypothetical protein
MRNPESPKFIASITGTNISSAVIPLFRKELASKGADFLADVNDALIRENTDAVGDRKSPRSNRVSVTIYYHELQRRAKSKNDSVKKRRNFKRER